MSLIEWISYNTNFVETMSGAANAVAALTLAALTLALLKHSKTQAKAAEESAKITAALRDIEKQRDSAEDPRAFVWFDGYNSEGQGSFVIQNAGKRSLFLRSLTLHANNMAVEYFSMDRGPKPDPARIPVQEIRDILIAHDRTEKFYFKFKNGHGHHFELLSQLYIGDPVRMTIDPSQLNGYELRAVGSTDLQVRTKVRP